MSGPQLPTVSRSDFLNAMSLLAHTVHIVTTDGPGGRDGMAVTAMCPVSADSEPPTLLICINAMSRPAPLILENGAFCVNVLGEGQSELCDHFAGRFGGTCDEWFEREPWRALRTGAPAFDSALANFDCSVTGVSGMGTHKVIFGSVLAVRGGAGRPLLHVNRLYTRLSS